MNLTDTQRKMNLSTNNEINSSAATSGSTGNSSGHTLPHTSHGTSRRTSTRSGNVTQKHSLCASSTSHDSTEKFLPSPSGPVIQQLKNLYCCNIPDNMMDRNLLRAHFQQFGHVVRIYLCLKRKSCTVHFESHLAAALAKQKGTTMKGSLLTIFWSQPAKGRGRSKDHASTSPSDTPAESRTVSEATIKMSRSSESDTLPKQSTGESHPRHRIYNVEKRIRTASSSVPDRSRMRMRHLLHSRKGKSSKALDVRKEDSGKVVENIFSYPVASRMYEMPDEVKDELDVMACNEIGLSVSDSSVVPLESTALRIPRQSSAALTTNSGNSVPDFSSSLSSKTRIRKSTPAHHHLSALKELMEVWNIKSNEVNDSAEDRYQLLELRDKILRLKRGKQSDLSTAVVTRGTCPDMCPEKERYQRESRHQVALYEYDASKEVVMDHALAVKQYSRSSADQEEPLPHDLRPPHVLRMTMDYLLAKVMDRCDNKDENLGDWYHFLWDRTRGIRKDITQQELCDKDAVRLVEQCARFHIHCSERLVAEDTSVFDNKINSENLTKCLQTLKYMYHDMSLKGICCPNEAEFRGYIILLNLNDANFMWELKELSPEIVNSEPVKFAIEVSLALSMDNYVRFFKLVRRTTYLNACILLRYFAQVRSKAFFSILRSHCFGNKQSVLAIQDFARWLAFENVRDAAVFCYHYGLGLNADNTEVILCKDSLQIPSHALPVGRAILLIERKRTCSVGEVVNGGPLTLDTFQNYKPQCSFNIDGTVNQETMDALNKMFNLETSKPPCKGGKSECGVSDDVAKMSDVERIGHQEQAIEEAEIWKSNEMMQGMLSEIIQEELQVFSDRLTNVGLLELDEMLLDVTCDLTREIYKDVVATEKEIARQEAEEIAKKEEAERQKFVDVKAAEFLDIFLSGCVTELIKEICEEEQHFHELCLQQMSGILIEVTLEDCKNILKNVIKEEHLELLLRKRQVSDLRKYFNIWKSSVRRMKLFRKCMSEFPAWMSSLTVKEQILHLEKPQIIGKTVAQFSLPAHTMDSMNKIPVFDIVSCELYISPSRQYSVQKYFKMVVSIPDEVESPTYGWFVKKYTENVFSTNKDADALNQAEPLLLERKLLSADSELTVSVRCLVGPDMIEGGISNPEAMAGTNGLLFLVCHDSVSESTKRRLHEVIKSKHHYGGIPVAFLVTDCLGKEQMKVDLNIESLMYETGIRIGEFFYRKPNWKSGLEDMFCKAVFWLAQNADDVPLAFCTTAENVMRKYLGDQLWEKFEFHENSSDEDAGIKMNLESLIHIHNRACHELLKIVTEETLNKCTIGAPEFVKYIPAVNIAECSSTKLYKVMPPYFGSPEYKNSLFELLKSAQFKPITKWPPKSPEELRTFMMEYCHQNSIPYEGINEVFILFSVCLHQLTAHQSNPTWSENALSRIPWISVFKLLFKYKLRKLNFGDKLSQEEGEREIMVAMNREKISSFVESQWLCYLRMKDKEMVYAATKRQSAVCDFARDGKTECGLKRKSGDNDPSVKKRLSNQPPLHMNVENVNTALRKLSEWLDECSSKQWELGQKLKTAVCDDGT